MQKFKYILYLLSAVLITGCGQTVVETLYVPSSPNPNAPGKGQTVIILPFADYTYADSVAGAYRRNLAITESLTDRFVANGFSMVIQEDVFGYLVKEDIINVAPYDEQNTASLSDELNNEWSDVMKNHLKGYIQNQKMHSGKTVSESPGTHALDHKAVAKMGRKFNADYIVRGRILEFKTREEHTWAPWKKGLLPFTMGLSSQTLNGFARSDTYDDWGHKLPAGTLGAIIGYNTDTLGFDHNLGGALVWGAVGTGLGHMAKQGGQVDQAVVQLRIWVQEAATGNVVWTNRIDVKVSPESIYADRQYDMLFDKAINKGVEALIDNFVTTTL
jgi:TolB-like protein